MRKRAGLLLVVVGALVGACRTSTSPLPSATPTALNVIAFGSCARQDLPQPIWDRVLDAEPELFLMLGDNIYADALDAETLTAQYARLAANEGFARLRAKVPILATWDDHDYGVNDGGGDNPQKLMYEQAFLDFFEVPAHAPRRSRPGLYASKTIGPPGQQVQVILLDTRFFRSPLTPRPPGEYATLGRYVPSDDATATMLGDAQWQWLEATLRQPAELRLIVSSIQVIANDHSWEKWGNLPGERSRLFRVIHDTGANGVVFLSGDRHIAELSMLPGDDANGVGYPLYDLTASGLTHAATTLPPEDNHYRIVTSEALKKINFGSVSVDWSAGAPTVVLAAVGLDGETLIEQRVMLADLRRGPAR